MQKKLLAKATTTVNAPVSTIWQALVNPEIIKQYLFNTEVISDWKVGSPITYKVNGKENLSKTKVRSLRSSPKKY